MTGPDLDAADAALEAGGAVVLPTDTVYGLAALPGHEDVLFALKGRPASVPVAVLVVDVGQAATVGRFDDGSPARRLADAFWPGPLTIVVESVADDGSTIGVRCPDHDLLRALTARVGPLPTTSANRHGEPTPPTAAGAAAALASPPALVLDGGPCEGVASTVVDATGEVPVILRDGALPGGDVLAVLH